MQVKRIAVLISGGGSNLQAIIDATESGEIKAEIVGVIASKASAYGLVRASSHGISTFVIGKQTFPDLKVRTDKLNEILTSLEVDLVVLAGYLSILQPSTIKAYEGRIVNIHPSLIPKYCGEGFYGHHVHEAVLANGEVVSGATTHFVDEGVDTGKIIYQESVPVIEGDTVQSLSQRVLEIEHKLIVKTVKHLCEESL
jgi:phosphoribosylglycinamide formyltransferase-1